MVIRKGFFRLLEVFDRGILSLRYYLQFVLRGFLASLSQQPPLDYCMGFVLIGGVPSSHT
ncbi:hypothetical protein LINPERPRIM_LOCUS26625 [Linum perenne]